MNFEFDSLSSSLSLSLFEGYLHPPPNHNVFNPAYSLNIWMLSPETYQLSILVCTVNVKMHGDKGQYKSLTIIK